MKFLKIRSVKLCIILVSIGMFFIANNSNKCCFSQNIVKAMEDEKLPPDPYTQYYHRFDSTGVIKIFYVLDFFKNDFFCIINRIEVFMFFRK